MVPCWNCQTPVDAVSTPRCPGCTSLQPLPAGTDWFSCLGLPYAFALTTEQLQSAVRTRSAQVHPDRFARASDKERRIAAERTASVNEAARVLAAPLSRALYLLTQAGVATQGPADQGMLAELMDAREAAEESAQARQDLLLRTRNELAQLELNLAQAFSGLMERDQLRAKAALEPILPALTRIRFLQRLQEDLSGQREHALP